MSALDTILDEVQQVLERIEDAELAELATQLRVAPRVFVAGEGRSGFMARAFAMRLAHLGLTVYVLGETITPAMRRGDLLVAVSGSGATHGTVHAAQTAIDSGARVVAVTSDPGAALGQLAHRALVVSAATKWRRPGEPATSQPLGSLFDQACLLTLDAICLHLARLAEVDNEQARARHASGE
jgi:6-phospho-3-hexuloisomerase